MSLQRRLDALELAELRRWADRAGQERGLTGAYTLSALRDYLECPDGRMDAFESRLTDAERTELVTIKAKWRRLLRQR
jgi:hypothetical protein